MHRSLGPRAHFKAVGLCPPTAGLGVNKQKWRKNFQSVIYTHVCRPNTCPYRVSSRHKRDFPSDCFVVSVTMPYSDRVGGSNETGKQRGFIAHEVARFVASLGSEAWQQGETRLEPLMDLSTWAGRSAGCASDVRTTSRSSPVHAAPHIGIRLGDIARDFSGGFVNRTRDFAGRDLRITTGLKFAGGAVGG